MALSPRCTPRFLRMERKIFQEDAPKPWYDWVCGKRACARKDERSCRGKKKAEKGKKEGRGGKKKASKERFFQKRKGAAFPQGQRESLWKTLWKLCKTPFVARLWRFFPFAFSCAKQGVREEKKRIFRMLFRKGFSKVRKVGFSCEGGRLACALLRHFTGKFYKSPLDIIPLKDYNYN